MWKWWSSGEKKVTSMCQSQDFMTPLWLKACQNSITIYSTIERSINCWELKLFMRFPILWSMRHLRIFFSLCLRNCTPTNEVNLLEIALSETTITRPQSLQVQTQNTSFLTPVIHLTSLQTYLYLLLCIFVCMCACVHVCVRVVHLLVVCSLVCEKHWRYIWLSHEHVAAGLGHLQNIIHSA